MDAAMQSLVLFLPFLLIMGGFMYFASRRQKRAMQSTIDLQESLRPGDRVHTTSGMEATIVAIADDTVDLEIAPGVVTRWMKLAVRDRILPDDDVDERDRHEASGGPRAPGEPGDAADPSGESRLRRDF
jgi:preprotein translocase subunit YajC